MGHHCWSFKLIDRTLYKIRVTAPRLRCMSQEEGKKLLEEIHSGLFDTHATPRNLVGRVLRQGVYWPTALSDAEELVRRYDTCQHMSRMSHLPATTLHIVALIWPFA